MKNEYKLEVKKVRGFFAITAGVSVLARYRDEKKANEMLISHRGHFEFWSNSASVSYENRIWKGDVKVINAVRS